MISDASAAADCLVCFLVGFIVGVLFGGVFCEWLNSPTSSKAKALQTPHVGAVYRMIDRDPFREDLHVCVKQVLNGFVRYAILLNNGKEGPLTSASIRTFNHIYLREPRALATLKETV